MIQVQTGRELEMAEKCRNRIAQPGEDVFVILAEKMHQIGREWELRQSVIFKSYIFVETADIDSFRLRLGKIEAMTKVLSTGEEMTPIRPEEEEFLSSPVHDTGNFLYAFFSFLLPVVGIIAAQVFKKKRYYRNYKACRKGAIIGFVLIGIILVLFLLLLLLAVI